jgi:hypothetical protein
MGLTISELKVSPPAWVTWVVTFVDLSSVKMERIESSRRDCSEASWIVHGGVR